MPKNLNMTIRGVPLLLSIPMRLRSGNDYSKRTSHWASRYRDSKAFEKAVWASAMQQAPHVWRKKIDWKPGQVKRAVTITTYRETLLDKDNLYAGAKPLIDALKRLAVIVDDAPKYCELEVRQVQSKEVKTQIIIDRFEEKEAAA